MKSPSHPPPLQTQSLKITTQIYALLLLVIHRSKTFVGPLDDEGEGRRYKVYQRYFLHIIVLVCFLLVFFSLFPHFYSVCLFHIFVVASLLFPFVERFRFSTSGLVRLLQDNDHGWMSQGSNHVRQSNIKKKLAS